ncbi:MAG TPA: hypothetical protein VF238_04385 [Methylomirabilota bacterium]
MSPHLRALVLAVALVASGCAGASLDSLDGKLRDLSKQNTPANQAQLAALAAEAQADAKASPDPKNRVAFYRVAAVAAWQAGPAGETLVLPITDEGAAACDALPATDASAPRDCSLIRLAAPLATQDALTRKLMIIQGQAGSSGKLPPAQLEPVQQLFDGLETQFDKVSGLRGGVFALDLSEDFKARTDRERLIIYCNGVKAWSLYGDVEGAPGATFNAMAQRKKQMTDRLEADGVATDCRTIPATQSFDAM